MVLQTVPVSTFSADDPDVLKLANGMLAEARDEVRRIGAHLDFEFAPVVSTLDNLPALLDSGQSILQIVSHANSSGTMEVQDVWGRLGLTPARLARVLQGQDVQVALIATCYGAKVAQTLVEQGVVRAAVGIDLPLTFAGARAFSRAFYRCVAEGRTVAEAVESGRRHAAIRLGAEVAHIQLFGSNETLEARLFRPPAVCLFGQVDPKHDKVIEALRKGLAPYRTWHVSDDYYSIAEYDRMHANLLMAKVHILLFDGQFVDDTSVLEGVVRAIMQVRRGRARLVPLYLEGTTPHPHLPFGMMRLKPAFLEDHESAEALGRDFVKRLVAPVVGPITPAT